MHIPDGFIDPKMSISMIGAALAVLSLCVARVKSAVTVLADQPVFAGAKDLAGKGRRVLSELGKQHLYKMGMVAALVFAAQLFDFQVPGATTGHLLGGIFAVVLLGPFAGTLAVALMVIIQAVFFADGGLLALGANVINIACIAGLLSYHIYAFLKKYLSEFISIAVSAWLSVMLAALSFSIMVGSFEILKTHAIVGIAEALATILMVDIFRRLLPTEK